MRLPSCGLPGCKWHHIFGNEPDDFQRIMFQRKFVIMIEHQYTYDELIALVRLADELG